jgi:hypothetical protein
VCWIVRGRRTRWGALPVPFGAIHVRGEPGWDRAKVQAPRGARAQARLIPAVASEPLLVLRLRKALFEDGDALGGDALARPVELGDEGVDELQAEGARLRMVEAGGKTSRAPSSSKRCSRPASSRITPSASAWGVRRSVSASTTSSGCSTSRTRANYDDAAARANDPRRPVQPPSLSKMPRISSRRTAYRSR